MSEPKTIPQPYTPEELKQVEPYWCGETNWRKAFYPEQTIPRLFATIAALQARLAELQDAKGD